MNRSSTNRVAAASIAATFLALSIGCSQRSKPPVATSGAVGETVSFQHVDHEAIAAGRTGVASAITRGEILFQASFSTLDGAGRPLTTGTGAPRDARVAPQNFNRISGPDANSCAGCHNLPRSGGGGDNVANVFVLGQRLPHANFDMLAGDEFVDHNLDDVGNERNTLGMFGSGYVELVAREITAELHATRDAAILQASNTAGPVTVSLDSKGVNYGSITAQPDGTVDASGVVGIDTDLIVKPFHQKGVVVSLREFTNNAMNHHHGMQPAERFGAGTDADGDGIRDELTAGDITAAVLYQATLPPPGRVMPGASGASFEAAVRGEELFDTIGCATCHVPEMVISGAVFEEPGPYNPVGNLHSDTSPTVAVDLSAQGPGPRLPVELDGTVKVPAYTDYKRHAMGSLCDNEKLVQGGVPTDVFLTKKLWGMASEPPYMHHGRATTLTEAILMHGGDSQSSRDAFVGLSGGQQDDLIAFLKTLQILPEGATSTTVIGTPTGFIGEEPAIVAGHLAQVDIESSVYTAQQLFDRGAELFRASFNTLDGAGRPESTGTGAPRSSRSNPQNFNRISGPDANSCAGCHNLPFSGGGGDNVANVFVMGQRLPHVNFDAQVGDDFGVHTLATVGNERGTIGMFGAGFIEMLAREMTTDLQTQRTDGINAAVSGGQPVTVELRTKGVSFGSLVCEPSTAVDTSGVVGVDADLVVKPFHQKGVVVSLRQFTNNATNHHHGMQSSERFGLGMDPDNDGQADELTVGDITALTLYQAMLPVPEQILPESEAEQAAVAAGAEVFETIGCAVCHVPALALDDAVFTEPSPFNPAGNLLVGQVSTVFSVDLTAAGAGTRLPKRPDGSVVVPAYTDLKRHDLGAEVDNETLVQDGVPTSVFLTKKLWGAASEPPYMHHGRALTFTEAIEMHGGEGASSRQNFWNLDRVRQAQLIDFLKSLRVRQPD